MATWGEDACAAMEAVFGDAVNNLGRHIHPMAGLLIYRGCWGSLDFEKHIVASDRCLTAIAKHLGMTVLGADDERVLRRLFGGHAFARVDVRKMHGGFSGSLVLRTQGHLVGIRTRVDGGGQAGPGGTRLAPLLRCCPTEGSTSLGSVRGG
mgnify:CR=1 FL=1